MKNKTTPVALLAALSNTADARPKRVSYEDGSPALARYTDEVVHQELWSRTELSPRDRSLVTVAALAATGRMPALRWHIGQALDNDLSPAEISEIVTHVAFYAGWPVGTESSAELAKALHDLDIDLEQDDGPLLALDPDEEAARRRSVAAIEPLAPGLVHFTDDVLFGEVWRRPGLAPRDRSLVTVATLIALGQAEQMPFHLNRALDAGLKPSEASEVVSHLAFYCGWPRAFSALGPLGEVLQSRQPAQASAQEETSEAPSTVTVTPKAEAPSFAGPPDRFTGEVLVESLFHADLAGHNGGGMVHFQPGAHTAWHTHPRGQTLLVTAGEGWVQQEGEVRQTLRTGDVVRIPPNVRHWHGATAEQAMSHVAIAESVDGSSVDWQELVPEQTYLGD